MAAAELQATIDTVIDEVIERELAQGLNAVRELELRTEAASRLAGFGVLQPWLDNPEVEEIWVNQPGEIFVATAAGNQRHEVDLSAEALTSLVEKMLRASGRRLDRSTPFVDASMPDGSRLHVIIPSLTRNHWSINIRKFGGRVFTLDDLLAFGSASAKQIKVLRQAMAERKNMLVSGATQAGKTTLLCALLAELEPSERLVSVEDTFEIRSTLPDWVALQTRQANLEGVGEVSLRRLIVEALRMRPTRLVVGEVRQAEALDLLIALNSGLPGLCTIHANSASNAIDKLATLPLLAGSNISRDFVAPTIGECIDLVVHCERDASGLRRIAEVRSVRYDRVTGEVETSHVC